MKCRWYGEEIVDDICQNPHRYSLICSSCVFNKGVKGVPTEIAQETVRALKSSGAVEQAEAVKEELQVEQEEA